MTFDFVKLIEETATDPKATSDQLRSLLRRAALVIRNADSASIDPAWSNALLDAMIDMQTIGHNEAIRHIVGEWLNANGYTDR